MTCIQIKRYGIVVLNIFFYFLLLLLAFLAENAAGTRVKWTVIESCFFVAVLLLLLLLLVFHCWRRAADFLLLHFVSDLQWQDNTIPPDSNGDICMNWLAGGYYGWFGLMDVWTDRRMDLLVSQTDRRTTGTKWMKENHKLLLFQFHLLNVFGKPKTKNKTNSLSN